RGRSLDSRRVADSNEDAGAKVDESARPPAPPFYTLDHSFYNEVDTSTPRGKLRCRSSGSTSSATVLAPSPTHPQRPLRPTRTPPSTPFRASSSASPTPSVPPS